jgi:hypothetical protein
LTKEKCTAWLSGASNNLSTSIICPTLTSIQLLTLVSTAYLLRLLVVVDLVVPAIISSAFFHFNRSIAIESIDVEIRAVMARGKLTTRSVKHSGLASIHLVPIESTHLVTVTPEEVLGSEVLVWVLWALLKWGHVLPVRPMLVPESVGVGTGDQHARNNGAMPGQSRSSSCSTTYIVASIQLTIAFHLHAINTSYDSGSLLDGELAPEVCFKARSA